MSISRRGFLTGLGLSAVGLSLEGIPPEEPVGLKYDFHVHLFGIGDGGTGCYFSEDQRKQLNYPYLLRLLGLSENGRVDQDYVEILIGQLKDSSIDKAVLVAQDGRYDSNGQFDKESTHFYIPNDYLLDIAARHSDLFVPCISINPKRKDAIEELDRGAEGGARVLKIHPPTQNVDPGEERFRPFYRRVAGHKIILMVHTGSEHSSAIVGHDFSDPARLLPALEEGCTVVASHSGMGAFFDDEKFFENQFQNLLSLVKRFPNIYCDTSILASMFRWRNLSRMLGEESILPRIVHASDYPFPSNATVFWNKMSPLRLLSLCSETNLLERDYQLKRAVRVPRSVFELGATLLQQTGVEVASPTP